MLRGERLAPTMRADFVATSRNLFATQQASQDPLEAEFRGVAERNNIDSRDVLVDFNTPFTTVTAGGPVEGEGEEDQTLDTSAGPIKFKVLAPQGGPQ